MGILGLDIGPSSIGWALLEFDGDDAETSGRIVDLGVRVFPEGVDKFDTSKEVSRNEDRRMARGMRRQSARRARRKKRVRDALVAAGLFPQDADEQRELLAVDPYPLRAQAVDPKAEPLAPHEIGRVLFHLAVRRGFLSNRKKDRGDKEVKGMLAEINENERLQREGGHTTIGAFLAEKAASFLKNGKLAHADRGAQDHVRNRHLAREQFENEFHEIWKCQSKHRPDLLTDALCYGRLGRQKYPIRPRSKPQRTSDLEAFGIHGLIFFQRPMYWPRSAVGMCELEPKEKRAQRSDRLAQRFRLLQEVNNLRYSDPDTHEEPFLDDQQRTLLLEYLSTRDKATFDQIRKKLGFLETVKFNLERGKRSSIKGMETDHKMAGASGKAWHNRPEDEKTHIVRMLLENQNEDDEIADRLVNQLGFTLEQADAALSIDFPAARIHLSIKALANLVPHMERGLIYMADDENRSAMHAAGYLRRDQLQRRLFDVLPSPSRLQNAPLGDLPNPVVKRALVEMRKVVNAIIREFGKPDAVHVEMARSVQMGSEARKQYSNMMREREARRDGAATEIKTFATQYAGLGLRVNRDSILRYLLWKEQNHQCVYCGKSISQQELFGGDVDVDHILPYSRCLDDSQMNKVVCHRSCNADKGNRTPHEWLADARKDQYDGVCAIVGSLMRQGLMPYRKYRRFLQKELDLDSFIARQLTDTGYIARAGAEYLRCLFDQPHKVLGLKGQHTAELRWQWGLNRVLRQDDEDIKNRDDHRHHAVDAVVIALTDRRRLHELTGIRKGRGPEGRAADRQSLPEPWEGFRSELEERINRINVSHRVERGVSGALHEETLYGPTEEPGVFVVRKPVENLSANEVPMIRDPIIRRIIEERLEQHGIEIGRGKKPDNKKRKEALANVDDPLRMPSGVPIKKIRILKNEKTIRPIRGGAADRAFVKPGSMHHLCLFEWEVGGKTVRDAIFVTQLEAIARVARQKRMLAEQVKIWKTAGCSASEINARSRKEMSKIAKQYPTIQRDAKALEGDARHSIPPCAKFIMSLSRGEMVLATIDGVEQLLVFNTAASTSKQMIFFTQRDARKRSDRKKISFKPSTLDARKVTVDPLGRIRWARD